MIELQWAQAFAEDWAAAWNAHDLGRILSHYDDEFVMSSPLIVSRMNEPSGTLRGKQAVGAYWALGLAAQPPLHFEVVAVCAGVDSVVIYYRSFGRKMACETFFFNDKRQVIRVTVAV